MTLLGDPKVRNWLEQQNKAQAAAEQAATEESVSQALDGRLAAIREHLAALASAVPDLPSQFWQGRARITADLGDNGRTKALLLLAFFVGLGIAVEWLFRKATRRVRGGLDSLPLETASDRLRVVVLRLAFAVGLVAAFALGSIGPFLALDWPPLLRQMLFGLLAAFLVLRIANVVSHFLLAPDHEGFRIIPMDTVTARFWHRRLVWFVGWFAFGWVIVGFGVAVGYTLEARQLVAYALGLVLLAIALDAVWRRSVEIGASGEAPSPVTRRFGRGAVNTALSVGIVLLLGVLGRARNGKLLAHSRHHDIAARDQHHSPCGREFASTIWFDAGGWRRAECGGSVYRARYPGIADYWRYCGASLGLGYGSCPSPRAGHLVCAPRGRCVDRNRHSAGRRRPVARHQSGDRS
jgi:hypothetical protein